MGYLDYEMNSLDYKVILSIHQYNALKKNVQALTDEQVKDLPSSFFANGMIQLLNVRQTALLHILNIPSDAIQYLNIEQWEFFKKQVQILTDEQVKDLPSSFFVSRKVQLLTPHQISLLSTAQVSDITASAIKNLNTQQSEALKQKVQSLPQWQVKNLSPWFFVNWKAHLLTPHQISWLYKEQIDHIPEDELSYLNTQQLEALKKIKK